MPDSYWKGLEHFISESASWMSQDGTREKGEREVFAWDPSGRESLRRMDEAGIEKTVLLLVDGGLGVGETDKSFEWKNQILARIAQKNPHRFVYFCGVDPRRKSANEFFERSVREWGSRGLKIHPVMGQFYPTIKEAYTLFGMAQEMGLPVVSHVGPMFRELEATYGHPSHLDRVLADFPKLTVIAPHLGFQWWRELLEVGRKRSNLLCDISAFQMSAKRNYGQFCHILRKFIDALGKERVLFGTDSPLWDAYVSRREWVELIRGLSGKPLGDDRFTEEEVSAILYGNARRLLA